MLTLRPYQSKLIDDTRSALRRVRSVLIQLGTGAGKTVLAAFMLGTARSRGRRSWFIAHRDFLLEQTALTFDKIGIPYGFIAAGRLQDASEAVQICSVGTLTRRLARYTPPDVIVWDECHHIAAGSYRRIYDWASSARHIGLSATPARLDGKGLSTYFDEIVSGPSVSELIRDGFLSPYRAFAPSAPSMTGVHTIAGDYNRGELDDVMDTDQIVGDLVRHYRQLAPGKRAIYYAVSVNHSQHIAATFNASGIPAMHLDGDSSTAERIAAARAFAAGDVRVISNVDLFGEGYDLSAQAGMDVAVEAIGLARPTQSLVLHLQQMGRGLRVAPGKDHAIILDHAGNCARHGLPDDEREWSLNGIERKKAKSEASAVKQCPKCFGVHAPGRPKCPYCGHVYEIEGREVDEIAGELSEIDAIAVRMVKKDEIRKARTRESLEAIARARGYKPGWVEYVMAARIKYRARGWIDPRATIR